MLKRIHDIELFIKYPIDVQQEVLKKLIKSRTLKLENNMILILSRITIIFQKECLQEHTRVFPYIENNKWKNKMFFGMKNKMVCPI